MHLYIGNTFILCTCGIRLTSCLFGGKQGEAASLRCQGCFPCVPLLSSVPIDELQNLGQHLVRDLNLAGHSLR